MSNVNNDKVGGERLLQMGILKGCGMVMDDMDGWKR